MKHETIRIDLQPNFKKRVDLVMKKLSKLHGLLKITREVLNLENRLFYYKTSIEAIMSYALIVYGNTNSNNLHALFLFPEKNSPCYSWKSPFCPF